MTATLEYIEIMEQEKITRGLRNNNPFNIRFNRSNQWKGKVCASNNTDKEFEQFISIEYGVRAGIVLLRNYIRRGINTPRKIIERFAPATENDLKAYLKFIKQPTRHSAVIDLDKEISGHCVEFFMLLQRISRYESGFYETPLYYLSIINKFRL